MIEIFAQTGIIMPDIDPVAFSVGKLAIRWYALSYVAGIFLGWWYLGHIDKEPKIFSQKAYDDFIMWAVLGVIVGGRLGYVLFYGLEHFLEHPLDIFAVWNGGMSFHGGVLGSILAMYLMSCIYKINFLKMTDLVACVTPIGLFFGRIANFINGELYGRVTDVSWAVVFNTDKYRYPRHPSQLYEAFLEGIVLLVILAVLVRKDSIRARSGMLSGVFMAGYALFRFTAEFFREPDIHIGFILESVTMGQILSIPMFMLGIWLIVRNKKAISTS